MLSRIPRHTWPIVVLCLWGATALWTHLLRFDAYGIDEAAARALLLNWTVTDQVANPVVVFGAPDLRALLFMPLGIYWPGSLVAVKVFSLLIGFAAAWLMYDWARRTAGEESALIATGLLLISPLLISQIDTLGAGTYLLLLFGLGTWVDRKYREVQRPLGGWFFTQLLLIVVAVTLHPAGLAYALALALEWRVRPLDARQQRHIYIGVGAAALFALLFRFGWPTLEWWQNPLVALGWAGTGQLPGGDNSWAWGLFPAMMLAGVILKDHRWLWNDLLGRMLLLGLLVGAAAADATWAMLALALLLYRGTALLIRANEALDHASFLGQRGMVMVTLVALTMLFTLVDRTYHGAVIRGTMNPDDELIHALAGELESVSPETHVSIISQWPARTMLATKRAAFPLPPRAKDAQSLLQMIKGVDYVVFNPYDPAHRAMGRQFSELGGATETLMLLEGGAVLRVRHDHTGTPVS